MALSLVIPCFNERDSLAPLLQALARLRRELPADLPLELVLVDDGSRDGTAEALRRQAPALAAVGRWHLLELSRNFGKEAALLAGLDHASGAAAVLLDADLQDPPELIPAMVALWRDGHQVVNGVRRQRQGDGWAKRLTAHWFYRVLRATSHLDIRLDASDFRLIDRVVIDAILDCRERVRFSKGFVASAGFRQIARTMKPPARRRTGISLLTGPPVRPAAVPSACGSCGTTPSTVFSASPRRRCGSGPTWAARWRCCRSPTPL